MSDIITVEKIAYDTSSSPDRGYSVRASYLKEPHAQDALIEVMLNGDCIRRFLFPAYKIYNISAHFRDIVDGELQNNPSGYKMAAWDGISGAIIILPESK